MSELPNNRRLLSVLVISVIVLLLCQSAIFAWGIYRYAQRPTVDIVEVVLPAETDLCPGDTLNYQFALLAPKGGLVDLKTSYIKYDQSRPSFARLQQFILESNTKFTIIRHTVIPMLYEDPETAMGVPWPPGIYRHRTIARIEGREGGDSRIEIVFRIKEDCHEREQAPTGVQDPVD